MKYSQAAAQKPQSWIASFYPSLDGLRAVAVLMVFTCHYGPIASRHVHKGMLWAGVDIFFVLSGFLITGILDETRSKPNFLRDFYVRRALRILPLYWTILLLLELARRMNWVVLFATFRLNALLIQNWLYIGTVLRTHANPSVFEIPFRFLSAPGLSLNIGVFWSLCVEEQFYLVWPLVVLATRTRPRLFKFCLAGIACVVCLRSALFYFMPAAIRGTGFLYVSTYTRCDSLLIGACVALWLRETCLTRYALLSRAAWLFLGASAVLAVLISTIGRGAPVDELNPALQTVGYTVVAVAAAGLLLFAIEPANLFARTLRLRWLSVIGRVSFGFYLLHDLPEPIVRIWTNDRLQPYHWQVLGFFAALSGALVLATLSYHFFERPFLQLKRILAPQKRLFARADVKTDPAWRPKPRSAGRSGLVQHRA